MKIQHQKLFAKRILKRFCFNLLLGLRLNQDILAITIAIEFNLKHFNCTLQESFKGVYL